MVGVSTHTYSSFLRPRSLASFGLISTNISCCSSASHGLERVSSPPPSYSTSRPLVMISGYCLTASLLACCTVLNSTGMRQRFFWSSWVGYLSIRSGRGLYSGSRCSGTASGKVPHHRARLGVAERMAAVVLHHDALDAARQIGLPVLAFGRLLLVVGEFVPPAELLQQHMVELGIAGGDDRRPSNANRLRPAG